MKVDELIGSLPNFEIVINNREEKKEKSIVFVSNDDSQEEYENDELLTEAIVLFGKQFNKVLKQAEWRPKSSCENTRYNISEQQDNVNNIGTDDMRNQSKGVQCHKCEGYGHIRKECATFLKKQKKSLFACGFNEDASEWNDESNFTKEENAMTGKISSGTESCDEELDYELAASYKGLYARSAEICKMLEE